MTEEFKPIETQAELDKIIEKVKSEFKDYDELKAQNEQLNADLKATQDQVESLQKGSGDYEKQIENLESQVKTYEQDKLKSQIAFEYKIPRSLAGRLVGDNEESLRADAESMAETLGAQQPVAPLASTEPSEKDEDDAYRNLANQIFKGE